MAVQRTCWTARYKGVPEYFTNGKNARRWEFISDGCRRSMPGWWHWCSTSPRVTSLHSSTSSLTPRSHDQRRGAPSTVIVANKSRLRQPIGRSQAESGLRKDHHVPASCWFGHSSQSVNPASFRRRPHVRSCPSRGRAPTYRLRAQPLLQRGTSTESHTTKFPLPAAKARALASPTEGGRLHNG